MKQVINGKPYFSKEIVSSLNTSAFSRNKNSLGALTRAELKIVKLISQNKTSQDITDELLIPVRTVDKNRSNILHKLKLDNKPTSLSIWATINKAFL